MALALKKWAVTEHLNTEEDMQLYLEACIEEDDGNGAMIRHALANIARTKNMSELAKKVGVSREGLYKALSEKGNPSFALILKLSRALGLHMKIA
ncbi:MAG: putative addiction module antidote protein [Mariprofundus sp.]|nr:putative addiction module antidote protein [Mariprofundus sp.]